MADQSVSSSKWMRKDYKDALERIESLQSQASPSSSSSSRSISVLFPSSNPGLRHSILSTACIDTGHPLTCDFQVEGLRSALPILLAPLSTSTSGSSSHSPSEHVSRNVNGRDRMYTDLKTAAIHVTSKLETLKTDWTSTQTQEILSRARTSIVLDGDLEPGRTIDLDSD